MPLNLLTVFTHLHPPSGNWCVESWRKGWRSGGRQNPGRLGLAGLATDKVHPPHSGGFLPARAAPLFRRLQTATGEIRTEYSHEAGLVL